MPQANTRLVAYVTDPGYLLPSLVSACQLSDRHGGCGFDIAIFTVSVASEVTADIKAALPGYDFRFIAIDPQSYMPSDTKYFREGHVPKAALGRLVLADYIPEQYKQVVYIDGDTQIVGDLSTLLGFDVPDGQIAAVSESFFLDDISARRRDYLSGLGIDDPAHYFNSGVLAFSTRSWREIGRAALGFFHSHPTACEFHDQSALNAVCKGRWLVLPPSYNFHTGFAELQIGKSHEPKIVHFTGREKPWNYQAWPWGLKFARPYRDFTEENPNLHFPLSMRFSSAPRYYWRGLRKAVSSKERLGSIAARRGKFRSYLNMTDFVI